MMKIAEVLALYCKTHSCGNCELVDTCSQVMNTFKATTLSWNKADFDRINKSFDFEVREINKENISEQERWKKGL